MKKQEKNAKRLQFTRPPPSIRRSCQKLIAVTMDINT